MNGRQIILTGPDAASPSEALAWGKAAGVQEGMAMQSERLREQVEAMRNEAVEGGAGARGVAAIRVSTEIGVLNEVLALLPKPGEGR